MATPRAVRQIQESPELLAALISATNDQPQIYQPGPYWRSKTRIAAREIRRRGLDDFRGETSALGTSYADNVFGDYRTTLDTPRGRPVRFVLEKVWPFAGVFDAQVALTRGYARAEIALLAARAAENNLAHELLDRYTVRDSLLGGCVAYARVAGQEVSLHHLRALQLIDRARAPASLDRAGSMFEIGGGFGANVQLMIDNFSNLRKVVYLDVVPNLYVGTSYLRTLFGGAVRDFLETQSLERLAFRDDDSLEILAIAPWQIERLDTPVDLFWNANSFVEMPAEVVANYARRVRMLPDSDSTSIVLATYGGGNPETLPAESLPGFFEGREFASDRFGALDRPTGSDRGGDSFWETRLFVSAGQPGDE